MTATLSHFRVRSAEQRVGFLEREAERLPTDEDEQVEVTAEVNRLYAELTLLDGRIQEAYFDGLPYSDDLNGKVTGLFRRWLTLAQKVQATAGTEQLLQNIREVAAALNPSDEMSEGIERLRDAALEQNAAGLTVAELVDR